MTLTFYAENTRQIHPKVKLIPIEIWSHIFFGTLSDIEYQWMNTSTPGSSDLLDDKNYKLLDYPAKARCLIAMLFSNQDADRLLVSLYQNPEFRRLIYQTLSIAAMSSHISIINRLAETMPRYLSDMLMALDCAAFGNAALTGDVAILNRLIEVSNPKQVPSMISARNYYAFRIAASTGNLVILNRLIELSAPAQVVSMLSVLDYDAFHRAALSGHIPVINRLMEYFAVFTHVEISQSEYCLRYIQPFIQSKLVDLRAQARLFEPDNLSSVFDIDDSDQAKLYFYIIRNIIYQNDLSALDDMRFLLGIPAVKALAHTPVSTGEPNELLRLALNINHPAAAGILLNIPAVRNCMESNYFNQRSHPRQFDLRVLAVDQESSMRALREDEERSVYLAEERYQTLMKGCVPEIIFALRAKLDAGYSEKPARLKLDNGEIISLPCRWDQFSQLTLSEPEYERALQAYYQHEEHSAWRWLSKPNPWISLKARYVKCNPLNHAERWSDFEGYQDLIALLYLASIDKKIPSTLDSPWKTRFKRLISEMALIGRAHNWDNSRERINANGIIVIEEYDDLMGDKPSCWSGVKKRLLQSMGGHPLFKCLTLDGVKQELRELMREHFVRSITEENLPELSNAWVELCDTGNCADCLCALDLPTGSQDIFIDNLSEKYGAEFTDYPRLIWYVSNSFLINSIYPAHVVRFAGEVDLGGLLQDPATVILDHSPALA